MKVLTIHQPWASLIIEGHKPFEFRGWRAFDSIIGQRIVIHASIRKPTQKEIAEIFCNMVAGGEYAKRMCLKPSTEIERRLKEMHDVPESMPRGAGLGTAVLREVVTGQEAAYEFGVREFEDQLSGYATNYGWRLVDIDRWESPVPAKGHQGFWNWTGPETATHA